MLMKPLILAALLVCILSICVCAEERGVEMKSLEVVMNFTKVPINYTCDGRNVSPKIEIHGLDDSAKSLAVVIDDPDSPSGAFTHWTIWNLPPIDIIPEGLPNDPVVTLPVGEGEITGAVQGANSYGKVGYMGPCPPKGANHRYAFKVYVLDSMLDLKPGSSKRDLEAAMRDHILQQGQANATYARETSYGD
jgi:hypothetical protein